MAESTKIEVRIVRCPKCENLLSEPKDCSFFKCGGCDTILCAKNKNREADSLSENNRVKETAVNHSGLSPEESDLETLDDVHSDDDDDDPCSKPNSISGKIDSQSSGLDRFRKRRTKRCDSEEGFRFSASNYFQDSALSSDNDEAIRKDRQGLVKKLDKLKEQLLLLHQPKKPQQIQTRSFEKAPSRLLSPRKQIAGSSYYPHYTNNPEVSPRGLIHNPVYGEPSHPQYSRQYIGHNNGHGLYDTHQSTCSCFHYDPYQRASGSVFPPSGLPDALYNKAGFVGLSHSPRTFPVSQSRDCLQRFADVQMNATSRVRRPPSRCRLIRSIAGGAPFITCKNCFKLLKLPDETDCVTGKKQRLRCGACSCLMEFSFLGDNKKLVLSTDPASVRKQETRRRLLHYEFDSVDKGLADVVSADPVSTISDKAQEMQIADSSSTSPSVSEDELSSDSPTVTTPLELPPLREFSINVRDQSGPRNQSSRSEQDRVMTLSKTAIRQNSMKEATEMDVSFNDDYSQDSANDENNRDDQVRTKNKGGFTSIVKNSFKDLKKSIQSSDVSVNGHLLPERLVKIAEKQAGPIRPGNYWYDYRAGFWGVMGNHCLGILPPFIEELNYPMPENCANGNTRVFVNGRELHQKDLRLLAARGLPRDKDRSYTVYISGRVIDEDTGEELNSLGKLAPTVDKLKRGFGMRVPRRATT